MSFPHVSRTLSNWSCQWCSEQVFDRPKAIPCGHMICQKCLFIDVSCQSRCPCCWYLHGEQFIRDNKICSVCCSGISPNDRPFRCSRQHDYCSQCMSQGCILCQFRRLYSWKNSGFRDLPVNDQHILYKCHAWEMKFEEAQKSMMNNPTYTQSNGIFSEKDSSLPEFNNKQEFISGSQQSHNNSSTKVESGDCMVCLESLDSSYHRLPVCGHCFHKSCIDQWFQSSGKQSCPTCGHVYGISKGPQPSNGKMTIKYLPMRLSGFENEYYKHDEPPTIEITYLFPSGIQGPLNPYPGRPFTGTTRKAYLPNTKEGKEILNLLKKAFDDQHIFTIGRSATTGQDNVITWNDIHHKTSIGGGPDHFGYPDPTYLYRIRQELADKGYK